MSARKSFQPKYHIESSPYDKIASPFKKNKGKAPYPNQFIYYNRNIKMRSFVITKPTTEADIESTVEAEEALDLYQKVLEAAACQIQEAFRKSKQFQKEMKKSSQDEETLSLH